MYHPLILITAGLIVGALIALTGIGGGAVTTPFLILVLKIDPVMAVGTDLVFAAVTKWMSGLQHRRQKNVGLRRVAWMALGSMPASLLASSFVLSQMQRNHRLQLALARTLGAVLVLVSLYSLARVLNWIQVREQVRWPPPWALALIGATGGGLVGMTSVGSGSVIMAALMIFYAVPPVKMVGLDVLHGALLTSLPAIVYARGGQVLWPVAGWLLVGSIPGAWLGTRLVSFVPQRMVRGTLSVFLIVAGLRLFL